MQNSTNQLHIHILTHNNAHHIERCLLSLRSLGTISVYDIGSTDATIKIAEQYSQVYKIPKPTNRSTTRNLITQKNDAKWQMYLHPWETLPDHHLCLEAMQNNESYCHLLVLEGQSLTKEVRLWRKDSGLEFQNYAFESIQVEKPNVINCMIHSDGGTEDWTPHLSLWSQEKPTSAVPIYYRACQHLVRHQWKEFIVMANHYLLIEQKATMSAIMTKYHLAMVYFQINQDYRNALKHLLEILIMKPLMAEFWCLLGDIHYQMHEYEKARHFYQNGVLLGKKRPLEDLWPLEINKYEQYPVKMIANCNQIEQHTVSKINAQT